MTLTVVADEVADEPLGDVGLAVIEPPPQLQSAVAAATATTAPLTNENRIVSSLPNTTNRQ